MSEQFDPTLPKDNSPVATFAKYLREVRGLLPDVLDSGTLASQKATEAAESATESFNYSELSASYADDAFGSSLSSALSKDEAAAQASIAQATVTNGVATLTTITSSIQEFYQQNALLYIDNNGHLQFQYDDVTSNLENAFIDVNGHLQLVIATP